LVSSELSRLSVDSSGFSAMEVFSSEAGFSSVFGFSSGIFLVFSNNSQGIWLNLYQTDRKNTSNLSL
jgi:hypothetical protein